MGEIRDRLAAQTRPLCLLCEFGYWKNSAGWMDWLGLGHTMRGRGFVPQPRPVVLYALVNVIQPSSNAVLCAQLPVFFVFVTLLCGYRTVFASEAAT